MAEQKFPNVVELNVGGTTITTSLSTLTKYPDSMLAAMFSGRQPYSTDSQGRYFIDCDGDTFKMILEYLKFGLLPPASSATKVYLYAKQLGLQTLMDALKSYKTVHGFNAVTILKNELKMKEFLTLYERMKYVVVSHSYNMNFSPITFIFSYEAFGNQNECNHGCDGVDSFWFLSRNIPQPDWLTAMLYELKKDGISCNISDDTDCTNKTCNNCQINFHFVLRVLLNDCKE